MKKLSLLAWLCLVIGFLSNTVVMAQDKTVNVAFGMDRAPYLFAKGTEQGLEIDIVTKALKLQGYQVLPTQLPQILLTSALTDDPNLAASAGLQADANSQLYYSDPYINYQYYVISHAQDALEIEQLNDLIGKKIAIWSDGHAQLGSEFYRLFNPYDRATNAAEFYEVNDQAKLVNLFFNRDVDVLVIDKTVFDWYRETIAPNLFAQDSFVYHQVFPQVTGYNVAFRSREIRDTFNRGLSQMISSGVYQQMIDYYLSSKGITVQRQLKHANSNEYGIHLNGAEKRWLRFNPMLDFIGDPQWLPFEGFDKKGNYVGIVADHLSLLEKRLGIYFTKHRYRDWDQALANALAGKADIVSGSVSNQQLYRDYMPVKSFVSNPVVIVKTEGDKFVAHLDHIEQDDIAIVHNASYVKDFAQRFPRHKWHQVETMALGLEGVSQGKYDAMVVTMALANFHIGELGLYNLRIVGRTDFNIELTLFVNKNKPILHSIVNKTLQSISAAEHQEILHHWIKQQYVERTNYQLVILVVIVAMLIIGIFLYWNRRLSEEIQLRKSTEAALKIAKENAEQATIAKSSFLSNMSHEIRTPMNAIMGFSELLAEETSNRQHQNFIKTIQSAGNALLTLINDILDLSKIEAGKLDIHQVSCDPHHLFNELANFFMVEVQNKQLEFTLDIDKNIPSSLMLDTMRLRQILFNLIGNAVKFTDDGFIRLSAHHEFDMQDPNFIDLYISIEDSGVGIAADDLDDVFGSFVQAKGQDNPKYGGTGLGLAISYRLAKLMNGTIEVTSTPDQGARFELVLYRVELSAQAAQVAQQNHQQLAIDQIKFKPATLLVVDDVDINRELVQECLLETELTILTADSGEQALEMLLEHGVDLILMDIRMPMMDGYEAAQKAKKLVDAPIIALTATVIDTLEQTFVDSAFDGYLKKPVFKRELYQLLTQYISYEQAVSYDFDPSVTKKIQLNANALKDRALIKTMLDEELMLQWKLISANNKVSDIKRFAEMIDELGQQYEIRACRDYAKVLLDTLDGFDITGIKKSLQSFPVLAEMLKKQLGSTA